MNNLTYRKIVKASAIYDVIVTFGFAFPILVVLSINMLFSIHTQFSFSGLMPEFLPLHLFFVNLMGSLVLVWSVLRITRPKPIFGLYDSFARFLFSFNMLFYLLAYDVTGVLWLFFVPELAWGVVQFFGYFYLKDKTPIT
ncbi:hypothetical protein Q4489_08150 [Thalassotalea sp. 1_MG-2023]|uniref:hypothetical protein n=1 Tax=Thalassotalea sp. 1_MG-2023 TaxID=3062680 RepID=UPI0026E1EFDF|nr:hypothetical protein [Thalassotalea sp. 1_MG-2023]MDO6426978.1 hypothetical protein [Thalassotalea sp. 1_MG-2023]